MLDQGAVVGLFPEGHRQRGGGFGHINPGVSLFSLREGVVTIPVVLEGTERVMKGRTSSSAARAGDVRTTSRDPPQDLTRAERSQVAGRRYDGGVSLSE